MAIAGGEQRTGPRGRISLQTFAAFELRDYRLLWANNFSYALVQGIERFAFAWLVIDTLQAGDFYLGLSAFALGIPVFFFSLPAGVLADRWNRRLLLVVSQVIVLVGAVLAAVLIWVDLMTLRVALGMALFVGTGVAVGQPVRQALIPAVVPPHRLMNAITLNSAGHAPGGTRRCTDRVEGALQKNAHAVSVPASGMGVARSQLSKSLEQGLAGRAFALEPGRLPGLVGEEVAARVEVRERKRVCLSSGEAIKVVDGEAVG